MTLKDLSILKWQYDCSKTRSMPHDYIPKDKFTDKTANGLTKAICTFIKLQGYQAERISSMGRVIDERKTVTNVLGQTRMIGSSKYIPGTSTKGTADISATIKGKSVKIEVKIGKDRQSEAQIKYQHDVERAGGIYFIAKDWDSFYTHYLTI